MKACELTASELWNHSQLVTSDQHFRHVLYRIEAEVPSGRVCTIWFHGSVPGSGTSRIASAGQLDLETAQSEIASNWIKAYKKYARASPPAPIVRETKIAPTTTANEVWVNTRSGKYWKPGSRFYGKTKEGEFMSELEALDRGYSPSGGADQ